MKLVGTYRSRNDWLYEKYYKNVDYKISRVLHCIGMINKAKSREITSSRSRSDVA